MRKSVSRKKVDHPRNDIWGGCPLSSTCTHVHTHMCNATNPPHSHFILSYLLTLVNFLPSSLTPSLPLSLPPSSLSFSLPDALPLICILSPYSLFFFFLSTLWRKIPEHDFPLTGLFDIMKFLYQSYSLRAILVLARQRELKAQQYPPFLPTSHAPHRSWCHLCIQEIWVRVVFIWMVRNRTISHPVKIWKRCEGIFSFNDFFKSIFNWQMTSKITCLWVR